VRDDTRGSGTLINSFHVGPRSGEKGADASLGSAPGFLTQPVHARTVVAGAPYLGLPATTRAEDDQGRRHEVLGIAALAFAILLGLALASYDARGSDNWIGPVGEGIAGVVAGAFGFVAWLLPLELGLLAVRFFGRRRSFLGLATAASTLVFVLIGCALLHLVLYGEQSFGGPLPGGVLGEVLGEVLRSLVGTAGAYVLCTAVLLITLILRTPISVTDVARTVATHSVRIGRHAVQWLAAAFAAWREAKRIEREERAARAALLLPKITIEDPSREATLVDAIAPVDDVIEVEVAEPIPARRKASDRPPTIERPPTIDRPATIDRPPTVSRERTPTVTREPTVAPDAEPPPLPKAKKSKAGGPKIVPPQELATTSEAPEEPPAPGQFVLPPTTILERAPTNSVRIDAALLRENAVRLVEKLAAYGVKGRVDEIHPGPVVTMYEVEPESGTKVSKIAGLADDLAMALAAQKVRIVAPIPGKARVGFELPNDTRETVYLRTILEDERWHKTKASLPIALGQDIAGQPVYGDLARMPHLLVAGATGAGKSVGINVMLASLLMKKTPEEVRLLMIDPKVVELAVFDKIPHMLLPVVTDMKKAALALRWAVDEMERRYQLFADAGARNITTYNERVQKVLDGAMPLAKLFSSATDETPTPTKLPFVVVVVDEFADLMMVAAKDVETAVARLAQKARAAGIHVILATQRPSVDVITGMIKANFPCRMAFKVSQREDSKTILGRSGAEHLLGMGDMLLLPPGSSDLKRVHSAYITEDEVKEVCDFLRAQGAPVYDEDIVKPRDDEDGDGVGGEPSDDPLYDRAVAAVAQAGYCSISHLQRQLGIGYNKAAKLVEQMEMQGVVGPASGKAGGRREVLISAL
jgi:S-DNA-T family DNA segregation ATPase FtsK/SpoIIIE